MVSSHVTLHLASFLCFFLSYLQTRRKSWTLSMFLASPSTCASSVISHLQFLWPPDHVLRSFLLLLSLKRSYNLLTAFRQTFAGSGEVSKVMKTPVGRAGDRNEVLSTSSSCYQGCWVLHEFLWLWRWREGTWILLTCMYLDIFAYTCIWFMCLWSWQAHAAFICKPKGLLKFLEGAPSLYSFFSIYRLKSHTVWRNIEGPVFVTSL